MKYLLTIFTSMFSSSLYITVTEDNEVFTSFPVEVGNTSYDAFLEQAKLTDTEVQALTPDTWYDFPKENA